MQNALASIEYNTNSVKSIQNIINVPEHSITQDSILLDYIKFFTTEEGADMLPYAYLEDGGAYDNLMKDMENYYLFNDEVELIKNNKSILSNYLSDIANIIEIGPGSNHSLENKTLPIINYAKNLENYYALDISENYLNNILDYIKANTQNINILPIKANFKNMSTVCSDIFSGKKCLMFLGSTLGNFDKIYRNHIIKEIEKLTKKNDIFILTFDTNQNYVSSLKAYNNINFYKLVNNILHYFDKTYTSFSHCIPHCQAQAEWNQKESLIETYFKVDKEFKFYLHNYGIVHIKEGQKLRGISVYKFKKSKVIDMIELHNFKVIDVLNNSNKMQMFICKRL